MPHLLIRGGHVVSMDDAVGDLAGDILIENDRIAAIGPSLTAPEGAEIIDARGTIVMPGFVNAHMHTWQTGLRGLAADWTIQEYLRAMHAGLATHFRVDDVYIGNLCGALNQLNCGTTTLIDWCHNNPTPEHTDAAIDGLTQAGIRAVFLHGSPKPDPKPGQPHFSEIPMPRHEVARLRKGRLSNDAALVTLGLAILGPDMSVYEVCEADFRLAREFDLMASMHVSGVGLTPDGFERVGALGLLGPHVNVVHANSMADRLIDTLVDAGVHFTVTAEVEMQMGFGRPLTGPLRARGAPISIGSDIESSMTGDMFTVTRMTLQSERFLHSLDTIAATGKGPATMAISCREALRWATVDGARAAGLDHRIGSLTLGKAADIVILDANLPGIFPVNDPVGSILLQSGPAHVDTVIIGGQIRKRGGRLLETDLARHHQMLGDSARRILADFREGQNALVH